MVVSNFKALDAKRRERGKVGGSYVNVGWLPLLGVILLDLSLSPRRPKSPRQEHFCTE